MVDTNKGLGILMGSFIAILIGVVLVQVIGDQIKATETQDTIVNETITISNTLTEVVNESITMTSNIGNTGNTSVVAIGFFGNNSNNSGLAGIDIGEEINFTIDGEIVVSNIIFSGPGPYNVTYNYTKDGTGQTAQPDVVSISFFGTGNVSTDVAGLEINDEVNFTKPGVITVSTLNFSAGDNNITYVREGDLFVANSTARTLLKLIPIFFVLGILAIAVMMFRRSFPDMF